MGEDRAEWPYLLLADLDLAVLFRHHGQLDADITFDAPLCRRIPKFEICAIQNQHVDASQETTGQLIVQCGITLKK